MVITSTSSLLALTQLSTVVCLVIPTVRDVAPLPSDVTATIFPELENAFQPLLFLPPTITRSSFSPSSTLFSTATRTAITQTTTTQIFELDPVQTVTATSVIFVSSSCSSAIAPISTLSPERWSSPSQMIDLASFNISRFACGGQNLQIVNGIPQSAFSVPLPSSRPSSPIALPVPLPPEVSSLPYILNVDHGPVAPVEVLNYSNSSIIQILYPAHSINPGNDEAPLGGAEFYAHPVNMSGARNVSMSYSIFFPVDFDFVRGGKLPGLYGGHTGCSGGNAALDCFSTRMMFRAGGLGELYLYAPKLKQTSALCQDPQSVCDAAYGLSIGRGSFAFKRGNWTHLEQTVVLNTPGKQDGAFTLDVDGRRVISRDDVFYRDILRPTSVKTPSPAMTPLLPTGNVIAPGPVKIPPVPVKVPDVVPSDTVNIPHVQPPVDIPGTTHIPSSILGGLFGMHRRRIRQWLLPPAFLPQAPYQAPSSPPMALESQSSSAGVFTATVIVSTFTSTLTSTATQTVVSFSDPQATIITTTVIQTLPSQVSGSDGSEAQVKQQQKTVQFEGIFFSTFFGGHDESYATPRDQYVWFKDFAVQNNDAP